MNFKIYTGSEQVTFRRLEKDSATVIEAGKMVTLDVNWLAEEADAASTSLAFTQDWAGEGQTYVYVVALYENLVFVGTADQPFVAANRNTEVDLVINSGNQEIDLWASTTDALKVLGSDDAGTVWSEFGVKFKINKPICL